MIVTPTDLYVSEPLTSVGTNALDNSQYISTRAFPVVPVNKQAGKYWEWPRGQYLRSAAQKRGPGQESAGTSFKAESKDAYFCDVFALHVDVDDFARANAGNQFNLDASATRFLYQHIWNKREFEFLEKNFVPGVWTNEVTPSTKWSNTATAKPLTEVRAHLSDFKYKYGVRPNVFIIQEKAWDAWLDNAEIRDLIKGGANPQNPAIVTQQLVAGLLGVDEILIAGALRNNAMEGQTDAIDYAPNEAALLIYRPRTAGEMEASAGYTFVWTDLFGVGANGERVAKFRLDTHRSDRIEAEANWSHKALAPDLGVYFNAVL